MKKLLIVLCIILIVATACVYDFGTNSDSEPTPFNNWCGAPEGANCDSPAGLEHLRTATPFVSSPFNYTPAP